MAYAKIRPKRGTKYQWEQSNVVLAEGELGIEVPDAGIGTGPVKVKQGNGSTPWNELPYAIDIFDSAEILLNVYPVNSIYMSVDSVSPASIFGGTWTQLKDRFLLGAGDIHANGETGGEAEHTLTVEEMPSHRHGIRSSASSGTITDTYGMTRVRHEKLTFFNDMNDTGGNQPHNNMPPYLAVYIWQRTA